MKTSLFRVTNPATEPVSLPDARLMLRVIDSDEDDYISSLITVARETVEEYTRQALVSQTWRFSADAWPCSSSSRWVFTPSNRIIELLRYPLISVQSVKYWPSGGGAQATLSTGVYHVVTSRVPGSVALKEGESFPCLACRPDAVEVNFTAGYASVEFVPSRAIQAIKLLVSHWYDLRSPVVTGQSSSVTEVPLSVQHLLKSLKVTGFTA